MDRRTFLASTGGAVVGLSALGACSTGGSSTNTGTDRTSITLPKYIAYQGPKPDLAGTEAGVQPGYLNFPSERPASVSEKPGAGGTITTMHSINFALPPGADRNKFWAGLNERLGVDLQIQMVPGGNYDAKFATTIAGNELPDMMQVGAKIPPQLPQLLAARFADLSDLLAGDKISEYPNLANIPTTAWEMTAYNGGIYGVPVPRALTGYQLFARKDLFEQRGASLTFGSGEEFLELCRTLTDKRANRWAVPNSATAMGVANRMLAAPNGWSEEGGKLTHANETEEMRQSLEFAATLWREGLMHPDAFAQGSFKQQFNSGAVAMALDNYPAWAQYIQENKHNPSFAIDLLPIPGFDGGEGATYFGKPILNMTSFKKADKAKLAELLRICNWLAAPFGTEEYTYRLFGTEGVHHTLDGNKNPVLTTLGNAETVVPVRYITEAPQPIFEPGRPDDVKAQHAYQTAMIPRGIANPVVSLYSDTDAKQGSQLSKKLNDLRDEIIQGRKKLPDWDAEIAAWRKNGGDTIRAEYEKALQEK